MDNKEFVSHEQAVALKELGSDEMCFGYYQLSELRDYKKGLEISWVITLNTLNGYRIYDDETQTSAPLKQQVFRWFREKYNMLANVYSNASGFLFEYHDTIGGTHRLDSGFTGDCEFSGTFTTYEKAENACIDKLIQLAKQQEDGKI